MRITRYIVPRLIGWLIIIAAIVTVGIAAFVYSGREHREAVQGIARQFFVLMEKASRVRRLPLNASTSPTPEGGVIQ
jgi:hypothetical protein